MKKRKVELEKRVFVLFFIITFLLVMVLIFIEWQLAKFGITQYEDVNIKLALSNFKITQSEKNIEKQSIIQKLQADNKIIRAIRNKNKLQIIKSLRPYKNDYQIENLIICDLNRKFLYGIEWELIDKYLPQIYQHASKDIAGSFMANFGAKFYQINYNPLYSKEGITELIAIFIIIEKIDIEHLNLKSEYESALISYDIELNKAQTPRGIRNFIPHLNDIIQSMAENNITESIHRLNIEKAVGINVLYDLKNYPSGIFVIVYIRDVNRFAHQSLLIFILILLAITLIMIGLLGNWFSKTILIPVKNISTKMQDIATNPATLEPIESKYTGVLGNMVDSFNTMNIALSNHSKALEEYKIITDNIDSGIFWLDNDFNVILSNPSFMKIIEKENKSQIIGKNLSELLGVKDKSLEKIRDNSTTLPHLEIYPNNKFKYVIFNIRGVKYNKGFRFFGSITDITKEIRETRARETLELELIKSNKAAEIGKKVEGIVHNINSPLNSILGYAQLIKKDHSDIHDIDKIIDSGKNIAQTVKGLLTKVKQSEISMIRPININELITQELDFCRHNLFFKHYVILEKDFQKNLPKIKAAYGEISLCIANIINNAIEALKKSVEKELWVRTYQHNGMVAIEIRDTGEGIEEENIPKIFESYFSTKIGKEGSGSGFGLGLAISKNIVEKYHGKITVTSQLGMGSTFTIFLPYK